jgi:hypothetical protein
MAIKGDHASEEENLNLFVKVESHKVEIPSCGTVVKSSH